MMVTLIKRIIADLKRNPSLIKDCIHRLSQGLAYIIGLGNRPQAYATAMQADLHMLDWVELGDWQDGFFKFTIGNMVRASLKTDDIVGVYLPESTGALIKEYIGIRATYIDQLNTIDLCTSWIKWF